MKKKILLALILTVVFTCLLVIGVSAATTETIDGVIYSIDTDNKTANVTTGNQKNTTAEIVIPTTITYNAVECTVSIDASAFKGNTSITSLAINGAVSIGNSAFENATNLQTLVIGDGATSISGQYVFKNCKKLTTVSLPSTLTSISNEVFRSCVLLTTINLDKVTTIGQYVFDGCSALNNISLSSATSIGKYAFQNCTSLTEISIPSTVTTLNDCLFYGCTSLKSVVIPTTLTSMNTQCFRNCSALASISFPAGMKSYGSGALAGCSSLTTITIDEGNTYFAYDATAKILLSYDGKTLYQYLDSNTETTYTIPSTITTINDRAFCEDKSLKSITIPETVTSIKSYAFEKCTALESFVWPAHLTSISSRAFLDCSNLAEVTTSSSLITIWDEAFKNCSALTGSIDFSKLQTIANSAFNGCSSLEGELNLASVKTFASGAFQNCSKITSVIIPEGITDIYGSTFKGCTSLKSVKLPSTINMLYGNSFENCTNLEKVEFTYDFEKYPEFGSNFQKVGNGAVFSKCTSLKTLIFPNSLLHIDNSSFSGCTNLSNLVLGESFSSINQVPAIPKTLTKLVLSENYYIDGRLFAWDTDKFTCPTTLVIYYTGTLAQAEALQAKNTSCWEVSHSTLVSYEEFTSDSFARDESVHYMVYGYNKCEAFYAGVHDKDVETQKFVGQAYVTDFVNASTCKRCDIDFIASTICGPIFDDLGYSTEDEGTAFAYAIIVNSTNIDKYIETTGDTLVYGFIVGLYAENSTGDIINANGEAQIANSLVFDFTEPKYDNLNRFELKFTNITNTELGLYCNAYVINDTDVSYIGAVTEEYKAAPVTFNTLPKKDEE